MSINILYKLNKVFVKLILASLQLLLITKV